jgi:hypothetical protein
MRSRCERRRRGREDNASRLPPLQVQGGLLAELARRAFGFLRDELAALPLTDPVADREVLRNRLPPLRSRAPLALSDRVPARALRLELTEDLRLAHEEAFGNLELHVQRAAGADTLHGRSVHAAAVELNAMCEVSRTPSCVGEPYERCLQRRGGSVERGVRGPRQGPDCQGVTPPLTGRTRAVELLGLGTEQVATRRSRVAAADLSASERMFAGCETPRTRRPSGSTPRHKLTSPGWPEYSRPREPSSGRRLHDLTLQS